MKTKEQIKEAIQNLEVARAKVISRSIEIRNNIQHATDEELHELDSLGWSLEILMGQEFVYRWVIEDEE